MLTDGLGGGSAVKSVLCFAETQAQILAAMYLVSNSGP